MSLRMGDADRSGAADVYLHQKTLVRMLRHLSRHRPGGTMLTAAEIGVFAGDTSRFMLEMVPQLFLYMIDPWRAVGEDHPWRATGDSVAKLGQAEFDALAAKAVQQTEAYSGRRLILRKDSLDGAEAVANGSLDLVFIDAEHTEPAVEADVINWWPKVRPGGILCGHDYAHPRFVGVKIAVDRWAAENRLTVEQDRGRVWLVRKAS